MTLDEAIKYYKECADQNYQLMNWLIDLNNQKDINSKVLNHVASNFFELKNKQHLSEYEKGCFDTYNKLMEVLCAN